MGGGRIVYVDSLSGPDDAVLTDHVPESGGRWHVVGQTTVLPVFDTGRLKVTAVIGGAVVTNGGRLRRVNGRVSVDVIKVGATQATIAGVTNRMRGQKLTSIGSQFYDIIYNQGTNVWQFVRSNATVVGTQVAQALTQDQVYRLEVNVRKNLFVVSVDGVIIRQFEDVQTVRGFLSGIMIQNNAATVSQLRLANWMVAR